MPPCGLHLRSGPPSRLRAANWSSKCKVLRISAIAAVTRAGTRVSRNGTRRSRPRHDGPQHDFRRVQEPHAGGRLQHPREVVPVGKDQFTRRKAWVGSASFEPPIIWGPFWEHVGRTVTPRPKPPALISALTPQLTLAPKKPCLYRTYSRERSSARPWLRSSSNTRFRSFA
jgi:hypothetical protein